MRALILGLLLMAGCSDAVSPEESIAGIYDGDWIIDGRGGGWFGAFELAESDGWWWLTWDDGRLLGEGPLSEFEVASPGVHFALNFGPVSGIVVIMRNEGTYHRGTISGRWWWDCRPSPECRADPIVDSLLDSEAGTFTARRR